MAEPVRPTRRLAEEDGPMSDTAAETRSVVVEREIPYPPEKIWRALTQPHLIEEWLMKNDFKPVVDHRFNLRADWGAVDCQVLARRAEQNAVLYLGGLWSRECGDLDAHADEHGHHCAQGEAALRAGSAASLPGRQGRVAAVLCGPGAAIGADGLT